MIHFIIIDDSINFRGLLRSMYFQQGPLILPHTSLPLTSYLIPHSMPDSRHQLTLHADQLLGKYNALLGPNKGDSGVMRKYRPLFRRFHPFFSKNQRNSGSYFPFDRRIRCLRNNSALNFRRMPIEPHLPTMLLNLRKKSMQDNLICMPFKHSPASSSDTSLVSDPSRYETSE